MSENTSLQKFDNNTALDIKRAAWSALSEESRKAYQSDFDMFFSFIKKNPGEVTASDILLYVQDLEKQGMKNSTINRKLASLSKMFHILQLAGEITKNPVRVLKDLKNVSCKISREVKISLTIDDIRTVTKTHGNSTEQEKKLCLIIRFLSMTGLRISELTGIRNRDITDYDNENKMVRILGKGKKERFIFLSNTLLKEIKVLYPDTDKIDFLFYSNRHHRHNRQVLWKQIRHEFREKIGADVHPHTLRHAFITHKISVEKQDIKAVSRYVGHADVGTTLNMYVDHALDVKTSKIKI
jgi:site-specific recombinase XerD